jgi:hypothetical protein
MDHAQRPVHAAPLNVRLCAGRTGVRLHTHVRQLRRHFDRRLSPALDAAHRSQQFEDMNGMSPKAS